MRNITLAVFAAVLANLSILLTPQAALAEDQILISRSDLQMLLQQPQGLTLPEGSGEFRWQEGVPALFPFEGSKVPEICKLIYYRQGSPWEKICSSKIMIKGDKIRNIRNDAQVFDLESYQHKAWSDRCLTLGCIELISRCPPGYHFDEIVNACRFKSIAANCPIDDKDCWKHIFADAIEIDRPDDLGNCKCINPDDLVFIDSNIPEEFKQAAREANATQLLRISIQDGNLVEAAATLSAGQALLLQP